MSAAGRLIVGVITAGVAIIATADPARSLPSFARQTGQPCGRCHTDFPGLTPFGRQFKLGGYTLGGGDYLTTIFSAPDDAASTKAVMSYLATKAPPAATSAEAPKIWIPPISAMEVIGFTHTQAPLQPPTAPWDANNNTSVDPFSLFWGGAFTEHSGAFIQATHIMTPVGGPPDAFFHHWTWDNTDVRYANTGTFGNTPVTYGITVNNNPGVQDLWNTTPVWKFPYASSTLAPGPAAKTIIDGSFGTPAHVIGAGAYAYINNLLYVELTGYQTLNFSAQNNLGTDPFGAPGLINGVAPYWRVALEPNWGDHYLMIGTFGMVSQVRPWMGAPLLTTFSQSDRFTDIGFDSQYQYKGENYWLTLRGSYIHEDQKLDSSFANGLSANPTNKLNTARAYASLAYGDDNRIVFTGQYFNTSGTSDTGLYGTLISGASPNSNGYIAEIAYIPFGSSKSPLWPWFNARLGVQYTWYNKFDGTKMNAHDNNTLFVYLMLAQ
jgi:hypothetical protein